MKKHKLLLLIFVVMACMLTVLIGCTMNQVVVPDDYHQAGYRRVLLYYNGGEEGGSQSMEYYVKVAKDGDPTNIIGGRLPAPTVNGHVKRPSRTGYQFNTWLQVDKDLLKSRTVELYDSNNNRILDTRNNPATKKVYYIEGFDFLDKEKDELPLTYDNYEKDLQANPENPAFKVWDFDFDLVSEDTVLVATWTPVSKFAIIPPNNRNDNFDAEDYTGVKLHSIDSTGGISLSSKMYHPERQGFQIEGFYQDYDLKIEIDTNTKYYPTIEPLGDDGTKFKVVRIYIKWESASFNIVSQTSQLSVIGENSDYYLKNDLDYTGKTLSIGDYSGKFEGNGHSINNLTVSIKQVWPTNPVDNIYSVLFGDIKGATINNLTFKNLSVVFERIDPTNITNPIVWNWEVSVSLFALSIDQASNISNVRIEDATYQENQFNSTSLSTRLETQYDPATGFPIIKGMDTSDEFADEHGVYPMEYAEQRGQAGYVYDLEYSRDYGGNVRTKLAVAIDGGKTLYGYNKIQAPSNSASSQVKWEQAEGINFGYNDDNDPKKNVVDCSVDFTDVTSMLSWEVMYEGGDTPRTPVTPSGYAFAGWYTVDNEFYHFDTYDAKNGNIVQATIMTVNYNYYTLSSYDGTPVYLVALWTRL